MSNPAKLAAAVSQKLSEKQKQQDLHATIEHLRAQLAERESTIRRYQKSRGGMIELAREICQSVRALDVPKHVPYKPADPSRSEVAVVANLSDLHIGELIRPAETRWFGAFNFKIAQARMKLYEQNLLSWVKVNRLAYNIPNLTIFGIGDYVSGDIHKELLVTNEFPLPGQVAHAGSLISEFVRNVSAHFKQVTFHGVGADNHGRLQPKPQAKQKAANNMSFLVHALIEASTQNLPNVRIVQHEDMKPNIEVARHKFIVHHGDTLLCQLGVPYYGMERERGREATRAMSVGDHFEYINIGHFHVPSLVSSNMLINGSLSGSTEFDHACGRHGVPSQISYLVHPKWGLFNFTAWKFAVEQHETDGRRAK